MPPGPADAGRCPVMGRVAVIVCGVIGVDRPARKARARDWPCSEASLPGWPATSCCSDASRWHAEDAMISGRSLALGASTPWKRTPRASERGTRRSGMDAAGKAECLLQQQGCCRPTRELPRAALWERGTRGAARDGRIFEVRGTREGSRDGPIFEERGIQGWMLYTDISASADMSAERLRHRLVSPANTYSGQSVKPFQFQRFG
jgi:hypothetical protein